MSRRVASMLAAVAAALACGPQVDVPEAGTTSATSEETGRTTGAGGDDVDDGDDAPQTTAPVPGDTSSGASSDDGFGTAYEDDGVADDGCTFTCPSPPGPPGGGGGGVAFECDLELQDCPEGEKCMPWSSDGSGWWTASRCSPLDPTPAAAGEPCQIEGSFHSGIDDCALGTMCQSDDLDVSDGQGTCIEICKGACADPDAACLQLFAGIPQCTQACDPLDVLACPSGRVCGSMSSQDATSGFVCLPVSNGVLPEAAPCQYEHECAPGLFCASAADVPECGGDGCCVPLCDVQMFALTCPVASGRVCTPVGAVPGTMWEDLGICILP